MRSSLYHLQLNIDFANKNFYKSFMEFLGWSIVFEEVDTVGYKSETNGDLWFIDVGDKSEQDYDLRGLNHIALRVEKQEDIENLVKYMRDNNIEPIFDTPRHRVEFVDSKEDTYYQVIFKSPDNIVFEVVYIGAK